MAVPLPSPLALRPAGLVAAAHLVPLGALLWWTGETSAGIVALAGATLPLLVGVILLQVLLLSPERRAAGLCASEPGSWVWTVPAVAAATALLLVGGGTPTLPDAALIAVGAAIAAAAIAEEITFRGAVFGVLARGGAAVAVLGSSALFGAAHMISLAAGASPAEAGSQALGAFGLGLVLAIVRLRTGSLTGPILIHIAWNLAVFSGNLRPGLGAEPLAATVVVSAMLLVLVALAARRRVALNA